MTSDILRKIVQAEKPATALQLASEASTNGSGTLTIAAGAVKGFVHVAQGKVMGAEIKGSGERGVEALKKLLALEEAAFAYSENAAVAPVVVPQSNTPASFGVDENRSDTTEIEAFFGGTEEVAAWSATEVHEPLSLPSTFNPLSEGNSETQAASADLSESSSPTMEVSAFGTDAVAGESASSSLQADEDYNRGPTMEVSAFGTDAVAGQSASSSLHTDEDYNSSATMEVSAFGTDAVAGQSATSSLHTDEDYNSSATMEVSAFGTGADAGQAASSSLDQQSDYNSTPTIEVSAFGADPNSLTTLAESAMAPGRTAASVNSEFLEVIARLEDENAKGSLSESQIAILEQMRLLKDPVGFAQSHPTLSAEQSELALSEEQIELMRLVEIDERSFTESDVDLNEYLQEGLDEQQKKAIESMAMLRDEVTFNQADAELARTEQVVSDDERWILEQTAAQLTPEQQKEQFVKANPELQVPETPEFKDFVEPEKEEVGEAEPTALETAKPIGVDYDKLIPTPEIAEDKEKQSTGLIDRDAAIEEQARYTGPRRRRFDIAKYIGPAALVSLCVSLFVVPAYLRGLIASDQSDAIARQQMRLVVHEEMASEVSYASQEQAQTPNATPPASNGSGGGYDNRIEMNGDDLKLARNFAAKGRDADAIKLYESYLAANPDSVQARMELIRMYIKLKSRKRARDTAILGFKSKCSEGERREFWALFRQCLGD